MKRVLIVLVLFGSFGCTKDKPVRQSDNTPSQVVRKIYDAVNNVDTAAYLQLLSTSRQKIYAARPDLLKKNVEYWKSNRLQVDILSESIDGTVSVVNYRIRSTGTRVRDTTVSVQLYLENGQWKYGV